MFSHSTSHSEKQVTWCFTPSQPVWLYQSDHIAQNRRRQKERKKEEKKQKEKNSNKKQQETTTTTTKGEKSAKQRRRKRKERKRNRLYFINMCRCFSEHSGTLVLNFFSPASWKSLINKCTMYITLIFHIIGSD